MRAIHIPHIEVFLVFFPENRRFVQLIHALEQQIIHFMVLFELRELRADYISSSNEFLGFLVILLFLLWPHFLERDVVIVGKHFTLKKLIAALLENIRNIDRIKRTTISVFGPVSALGVELSLLLCFLRMVMG